MYHDDDGHIGHALIVGLMIMQQSTALKKATKHWCKALIFFNLNQDVL